MDSCCGQGATHDCRCYADAQDALASVRAFVRRRVRNAQDAEDVTQEALLRLYRSVEDLRRADAFEAWMYQVARSAITDHYRRAGRAAVPVDPDGLEAHAGTGADEEPPVAAQLAECLRNLLRRIPEDYRTALELTDLGDLTQQEAARRLGLSGSGMKSRVQRGRRLLRAEVTRCCAITLGADGSLADAEVRAAGPACS